jgi:sec-independent protein translocase protein TatB
MFDIGFSEVLLIFVIALVVLGPEKLPRVASQVGRWIGRARSMARQFREQLEEEVNLEQVRKAHEKPKSQPNTDNASGTAGSSGTTTESVGGAAAGAATAGAASSASDAADASGATGVSDAAGGSTHDASHAGEQYGSEASQDTSSAAAATYRGPDPADFRADTFSHAHPTNEYGANPYTASGAAEDPPPAAAETPSEANVAAAQPQPESDADRQAGSAEAYAPHKPRDNTPGTDNHGN